jgi:DNA invertase Pin-like site-specific DNA recombinase
MQTKAFGYVRVSSKEQNIDRQVNEMLAIGINERDIFVDKQSGKDFDRPMYQGNR